MKGDINLKHIKHGEIDRDKWDHCIDNAPNCRVYAYTWHLDRTAEVWDALVWGDYEFVMPLPYRVKLGIKYLYQPIYSQQLGIFPTHNSEIASAFYNFIIANYRYCDMQINSESTQVTTADTVTFVPRKNYLLPLNKQYNSITSSFSKNTKRNIAKAKKQNLSLVDGIQLEEYLKFKSANLRNSINKKDLLKLKSLIAFGHNKGFGKIYGVYSSINELCAAVYFCRWKNRVIYFNAASSVEGKKQYAMHYLMNQFIESNAGKNLILDFEGSMIPGVARFYDGFGATAEHYFQVNFNRLPLLVKWLKHK